MKRLGLLFLGCLILCCGCEKEEPNLKIKTVTPDVSPEEVVPAYEDLNHTPIGIYSLNGNTLTKLTTIHKQLNVEEDIGVFQVYPSNEDTIYLDIEEENDDLFSDYVDQLFYPKIKFRSTRPLPEVEQNVYVYLKPQLVLSYNHLSKLYHKIKFN